MAPWAVPPGLMEKCGLASSSPVHGDALPESFNAYHKCDGVNEWQREPGDPQRPRWGVGCRHICA